MIRAILTALAIFAFSGDASAQCQNGRCPLPNRAQPQFAPFYVPTPIAWTKYADAYRLAESGVTFTATFSAGDGSLPATVPAGTYRCTLYRGVPAFNRIG